MVEESGFDTDKPLYCSASRPVLRATQISVMKVLSPSVERLEADHCPPSTAEVTNAWCCISTCSHVLLLGSFVIQAMENFTFRLWPPYIMDNLQADNSEKVPKNIWPKY
jgi:hypothetical protein